MAKVLNLLLLSLFKFNWASAVLPRWVHKIYIISFCSYDLSSRHNCNLYVRIKEGGSIRGGGLFCFAREELICWRYRCGRSVLLIRLRGWRPWGSPHSTQQTLAGSILQVRKINLYLFFFFVYCFIFCLPNNNNNNNPLNKILLPSISLVLSKHNFIKFI